MVDVDNAAGETELRSGATDSETNRDDANALAAFYYMVISAQVPISVHEPSGTLQLHNPECVRMLGYDSSELKDMDGSRIIHRDDAAALGVLTQQSLAGTVAIPAGRLRLVHKNGYPIEVDLTMESLRVGGHDFLVVTSKPVAPLSPKF